MPARGLEIMKYSLENIFNLSYYGVNNNTTLYFCTSEHNKSYTLIGQILRIKLLRPVYTLAIFAAILSAIFSADVMAT